MRTDQKWLLAAIFISVLVFVGSDFKIQNLFQLGLQILLIAGFYHVWRRVTATDDERRLDDRFRTAIELLGSEKTDVRTAGIFALERLARESSADRWAITEMLCAYIRRHSPVKEFPERDDPPSDPASGSNADIQAALTALGRRVWTHYEMPEQTLNLSRADLRSLSLRDAYFEAADFGQADFAHADLRGANLNDANLGGAGFAGADLKGARLKGADLRGADLGEAQNLVPEQIEAAIVDRTTKLPF